MIALFIIIGGFVIMKLKNTIKGIRQQKEVVYTLSKLYKELGDKIEQYIKLDYSIFFYEEYNLIEEKTKIVNEINNLTSRIKEFSI